MEPLLRIVSSAARDAVRARAIYDAIATRDPKYANLGWVHYQWGRVLLSENNVEEAVEKFTEALIKPSTVRRLTALIYERLGFARSHVGMTLRF
jgi:tetratricopeptide (TPR) repeat protein